MRVIALVCHCHHYFGCGSQCDTLVRVSCHVFIDVVLMLVMSANSCRH